MGGGEIVYLPTTIPGNQSKSKVSVGMETLELSPTPFTQQNKFTVVNVPPI